MKFELSQVLEIIEGILKSSVNHAKYGELIKMKEEVERLLQEKETNKCDFCTKPCGNDHCVTKDKNE